jgi:hypothetical protein
MQSKNETSGARSNNHFRWVQARVFFRPPVCVCALKKHSTDFPNLFIKKEINLQIVFSSMGGVLKKHFAGSHKPLHDPAHPVHGQEGAQDQDQGEIAPQVDGALVREDWAWAVGGRGPGFGPGRIDDLAAGG